MTDKELGEEYQRFLKAEWFDNPGKHTMSEFCILVARHFACWQKEQMTKGAMPRIVKSLDAASYNHCIAHLGLSGDDKVKLIIIKDN